MALDNYVNSSQASGNNPRTPSKDSYSRRSFLGKAAAATAGLFGYSSSRDTAYAADSPSNKKREGLEKKIPDELLADLDCLKIEYHFIDGEKEREEYNKLSREYMKVLIQKGKYDPKNKKELQSFFQRYYLSPKSHVTYMQKDLLREKDPEAYLKQVIKDPEKIKFIRLLGKPFVMKAGSEVIYSEDSEKNLAPWKMNYRELDLSDQIFVYEFIEGFKNIGGNLGGKPGTISGNPLVR